MEAGRAALEALGTKADALLVFAAVGYDQALLIKTLTDTTGVTTLVGCSAGGTIGRHGSDESACSVVVMAMTMDGGSLVSAVAYDVAGREPAAAAELAAAFADQQPSLIFLLPDGLSVHGAGLVEAFEASLAERKMTAAVVGGAAGELHQFERTFQYINGEVISNGVVALGLGGAFGVEIEVTHGCELLGIDHQVTKADKGLVYELDGKPAWSVLQQYLDDDAQDLSSQSVPFLCLARPLREGVRDVDSFVIRVPLRLDKETDAVFFSGGLVQGDTVMMARRDEDSIRTNAIAAGRRIVARRQGAEPLAVVQFDCVGRGRLMFGDDVESELINPVMRLFGPATPWIGFHSYGEIAPLQGASQFHSFTVALCALYEMP